MVTGGLKMTEKSIISLRRNLFECQSHIRLPLGLNPSPRMKKLVASALAQPELPFEIPHRTYVCGVVLCTQKYCDWPNICLWNSANYCEELLFRIKF